MIEENYNRRRLLSQGKLSETKGYFWYLYINKNLSINKLIIAFLNYSLGSIIIIENLNIEFISSMLSIFYNKQIE